MAGHGKGGLALGKGHGGYKQRRRQLQISSGSATAPVMRRPDYESSLGSFLVDLVGWKYISPQLMQKICSRAAADMLYLVVTPYVFILMFFLSVSIIISFFLYSFRV